MKVDVRMSSEDRFEVSSWWATQPEYVINALKQQLEAATAIWPELKDYQIGKKRSRNTEAVLGRDAS